MRLSAIDLFAGCGGLSWGLTKAGFQIVAACEIDKWASDTYERNHRGVTLLRADVREVPDEFWIENYRGQVDLVAGGPPCQGFSVSGKRQYGKFLEHNTLVEEFLRVVRLVSPPLILIENVQGFKTGYLRPGLRVIDFVARTLSSLGYRISVRTLQACEYGVPSLRSRIFLIGSKLDLAISPFPVKSHGEPNLLPLVSVANAIDDLPGIKAGEGSEEPQPYLIEPMNSYQMQVRIGSIAVYNHVAMNHTPRLIERFSQIPPGGSGYRMGRSSGDNTDTVTVYKSNNQRLRPDRPSLCITANFQSNYVHPRLDRNLTAREAARLMTFPDSFVFLGKRTQMSSAFLKKYGREHENFLSQYNQIGNAVPPLLAERLGRALIAAMHGHDDEVAGQQLELAWNAA